METVNVHHVLVVRLLGDLDHHVVEQIRDELEMKLSRVHHRGLVLSFRGIDFMDSSGLGLIFGRYRSVTQHQGKMALCEVSSALRRLFELSGVLKVIPVYDSEEDAIRFCEEA